MLSSLQYPFNFVILTLSAAEGEGPMYLPAAPENPRPPRKPRKFRIAPRSITEERFEQAVRRCVPSHALSAVEQAPGVLLKLFEAITYEH